MLIGLSFTDTFPDESKENLGISIATEIGRRTRVVEPRSLEEFNQFIKKYNPSGREHLVLVTTHLDFERNSSLGRWRAADMVFAQKGGVVYGKQPERETISWVAKIKADNLSLLVKNASYEEQRAYSLKKEFSGYFGRGSSDPHTLVLGFKPDYPKLSIQADALLAGLPEEWWTGVGFYNGRAATLEERAHKYSKVLDRFYYSSYVTVSDHAHAALEYLEVPHQQADKVVSRDLGSAIKYGNNLRALSRLDAERVVE